MASQKAKELRALALSLSLVNDDLKNKRYLRKSEFYKESDRYKMERQAQQQAALNLANELKNKTPTISAALINAVNNAPAEIVGHAGDGEIKEGDIKNTAEGDTNGKIPQYITDIATDISKRSIEEAIANLQKTPFERAKAKRERGLSDDLFGEIIDTKIDDINKNVNNAVDLSPEILKKASQEQLTRLYNLYNEKNPTTKDAYNTINKHLVIIEDRLEKMEKQAQAEAELVARSRGRVIAQPTKPKLVKSVTPGKVKVDIKELEETKSAPPPKKRGRPRKNPVEQSDKPKRGPGRPRKKPVESEPTGPKRGRGRPKKTKEPIVSQSQSDKKLEEMLRERQKSLQPITKEQAEEMMKPPAEIPRIIVGTAAEAAGPKIEGEGLKDFMAYMKGRKPTKKMKKLIMLIGSQRAGNNSYKLKVEIDKLMADIRQDLQGKISKHKAKSARKQSAEIAKQKRMMQIRQQAKQQMEYERSLAKY